MLKLKIRLRIMKFLLTMVYFKEDELIITEGNSKGTDKVGQVITANNFEYDKIKNILKQMEMLKLKIRLRIMKFFRKNY